MVALKLQNFGGMIPAVDARLLPDNQAADSRNTWLYRGRLEGMRNPRVATTSNNPLTRKIFRIPKEYFDKEHIPDSYWVNFTNPDVDVIQSPVVNDQYDRYYYAQSQTESATPPMYTTKARVAASLAALKLGIPAPTIAPFISRDSSPGSTYWLDGMTSTYALTAGSTTLYYTKAYGVDQGTFADGLPTTTNYAVSGASRIIEGTNSGAFTVTFTNGSANIGGTGLPTTVNDPVVFRTTGVLPTNFTVGTTYYIRSGSTSTVMTVSATPAGAPITAGSAGSGVHTLIYNPVSADIDASGTPAPALRPRNLYTVSGQDAEMRYTTTNAGQRITISDSGKITLGLPTATTTGSYVGTGQPETRAYVYTWVSSFGEEGPPSPPALYDGYSGDPWFIRVTAPGSTVTTDRSISKVRIYRTVTSSVGAATYFFVAEFATSTTSYKDDISGEIVTANRILESTYWTPPPDDLEGWVSLPNGIIAAWRNNEIWFCEPYHPHAWPVAYTVAVEAEIVGLGVIGQSIIVCTTGNPYTISGTNPAAMSISKIAAIEPCTSRGSIVSTPNGVVYSSPSGLAIAVPGQVQIVTRDVMDRDLWQGLMNLSSLRAAIMNGGYYCWGSVTGGCFDTSAFNEDAFQPFDFTGAYTGALIDISNKRVGYNRLEDVDPVLNVYTDYFTGEVFVLRQTEFEGAVQPWLLWIDPADSPGNWRMPYLWSSKVFEMPNRRNFEAMRIFYDESANDYLFSENKVRVYADNRLVLERNIPASGQLIRLPSGFKAMFWQVELETAMRVYSVEIATAAKELGSV